MVAGLEPGLTHSIFLTAAPEMAAPHLGPGVAVISTPSLIGLMERCVWRAVRTVAPDANAEAVQVRIEHRAAHKIGDPLTVNARLATVEGGRGRWELEITDGEGKRIAWGELTALMSG